MMRRLIGCLGLGLTIALAHGAPRPAAPADIRRDATVIAVENVLPAVVNVGTISVERADPYDRLMQEFFGYNRRSPDTVYSSGSGVIIDEEGWILTNFHVVRGAVKVQVTLAANRETLEAEVVSVSEINDLALLRIKAEPERTFRSVALAADEDLLLGETVLALGNPYGLGASVSRGILSSKTRRPEHEGESMEPEDWLQTDASINPGNSGGPLVNLRGELIGLNVAILARAQGIGFAIPVKRISAALSEMVSPEATAGMWFGARVQGSRPPVRATAVQKGGPAESAGLAAGDEVLQVNGSPVRSFLQFYRELRSAGRDVQIQIRRGDQRHELKVRLASEASIFNADYLRKRMGLSLEPVPEDIQRTLGLNLTSAMVVGSVDRGGPAADAGIARGQIVTFIDGNPAADLVAVGRSLNRRRAGEKVIVDVLSARRRGMFFRISEGRAEVRLR